MVVRGVVLCSELMGLPKMVQHFPSAMLVRLRLRGLTPKTT